MSSGRRTNLAAIATLALLATAASAQASTVSISPVDTAATKSVYTGDLAVDANGVVWLYSGQNHEAPTGDIERYRVAADGTITSLTDAHINKFSPLVINNGLDSKLYMLDAHKSRVAVVTVDASSDVTKVRYIKGKNPSSLVDATADSRGRVYVLMADRIVVLKPKAKKFSKPTRTIFGPFGGDDMNLAVADDGTIFVSDFHSGNVFAFTTEQRGEVVPARTINVADSVVSAGYGPLDVAICADGSLVVPYWYKGVAHFNPSDEGVSVEPYAWNPLAGAFENPQGITVDQHNHMIVGDYLSTTGIKVFDLPVG